MSKRQIRKMFQLMGSGEAVELTSAMASVKKLSRLACIAEQFGYQYVDTRQSGGRNGALKMYIVPDPSPHAQQRAAQNRAQYPQAANDGPLPDCPPDALDLLKARINFDLTGKSAEKRMALGAVGITVGVLIAALRTGDSTWAAGFWVFAMVLLGIGVVVTRKRNAKFAARLQSAGFVQYADETGRVRFLPPGTQLPGQGNPFANGAPAGPYGQGAPAGPPAGAYGQQQPGPYGAPPQQAAPYGGQPQQHQQHQPGAGHPYGQQQPAPAPYGGQQPGQPGPYGHGPYGNGPYGQQPQQNQQQPYAQPYPPQQPAPQPGAVPPPPPYGPGA